MARNDDNTLLLVAVGLFLFRDWLPWGKGTQAAMQDAGVKAWENLHDDPGHVRDLPGKAWTKAQVEAVARGAGFPDPHFAMAIAMAESGGVTNALGDSGRSVGLWQINTHAHPKYTREQMRQPRLNALAALDISDGGKNWNPWSVYKSGAFRRYL